MCVGTVSFMGYENLQTGQMACTTDRSTKIFDCRSACANTVAGFFVRQREYTTPCVLPPLISHPLSAPLCYYHQLPLPLEPWPRLTTDHTTRSPSHTFFPTNNKYVSVVVCCPCFYFCNRGATWREGWWGLSSEHDTTTTFFWNFRFLHWACVC